MYSTKYRFTLKLYVLHLLIRLVTGHVEHTTLSSYVVVNR